MHELKWINCKRSVSQIQNSIYFIWLGRVSEWVSEWESECLLFNANSAIFSYIMARTSTFWMRWWLGPLYIRPTWFYTDRHVALSDTLCWFRSNQSLLFLRNAAYLRESNKYQFLVFGLTRSGLEPTNYHTPNEHANNYTTDAVHFERRKDSH